jgi:HEAT repeat protein
MLQLAANRIWGAGRGVIPFRVGLAGWLLPAYVALLWVAAVRCEPPDPPQKAGNGAGTPTKPDGGGTPPVPKGPASGDSARIERLIRRLGSDRFEERQRAAQDLVAAGAPALEPLRQALKSSDPEVNRLAARCIPQIEHNLKVAALIDKLRDRQPQVRADAADELFQLGRGARAAVPALVKVMMDDPDTYVRQRAIVAMWEIGPEAKAAVPKLISLLKNKKAPEDLRWCAAIALEQIGPAAQEAVPALVEVLETEGPQLKKGAVVALAELGGNHKEVVPALLKALDYPDVSVQAGAAGALAALAGAPETSVPAIVRLVKKYHGWQGPGAKDPRLAFVRTLGGFGCHGKLAVPSLVDILNDEQEDFSLRLTILEALAEIGPEAKAAVPALQALLHVRDPALRSKAREVLKAIDKPER